MIRKAFKRAAIKPEGTSGVDFVEAILRERPDLRGQPVSFPTFGAVAHTVFIGNEVFKGPKEDWGIPGFDREYKVLQKLDGKGLPVPKVTCVGKEFIFFGMTRMPGVPLGKDFCDRLTGEEQRALARDIAGFMIDMALALPARNGEFALHKDLQYHNILIDPDTKRLSAIIDFGKADGGDYAPKDSLPDHIRPCMGEPFIKMCREEFALRKSELPDIRRAAPSAKHNRPKR